MKQPLPVIHELIKKFFDKSLEKTWSLTQGRFKLLTDEYQAVVYLDQLNEKLIIARQPMKLPKFVITICGEGRFKFYQIVEVVNHSNGIFEFDGLSHNVHYSYILEQNEINFLKGYISCVMERL